MKSIALLATALFLASAPSPDSDAISELSAGFLLADNVQPLLAAQPEPTIQQVTNATDTSVEPAVDTENRKSLRQAIKSKLLVN